MVKIKEQTILSREDLAKHLLSLAAQLSTGKLSFQDIELKVSSNLDVKYKYKNKDGFSKFKISFKWPEVGTVPTNTDNYQAISARSVPQVLTGSYKELKKQLQTILDSISDTINSGQLPTAQQIDNLIKLTDSSTKKSKPKLVKGMQAIEKVVLDLKKAVDGKDIERIKQKITMLNKLKENYHQQFK